jgi:hypothetical protein
MHAVHSKPRHWPMYSKHAVHTMRAVDPRHAVHSIRAVIGYTASNTPIRYHTIALHPPRAELPQ